MGPAQVGVFAALALVTLVVSGGCVRARDELPTVVATSGVGPSSTSAVAAPSLPPQPPEPCTATPPEIPTTAAPSHPVDQAVVNRVQQYLDDHPDEAGSLIIDERVPGGRLYAGFVSNWCQHRLALQQLVGGSVGISVFVVVQPYRAAHRLMDEIWAAGPRLRQAGIEIATVGVDSRSGLTSVTTPNDPSQTRAVILRELALTANAPIVVAHGSLPVPALTGSTR